VISGFRLEVAENCVLLGYYSGFKNPSLRMRKICCPETSVRNYHYSLRNNPEERSSQSPFYFPLPVCVQLLDLIRARDAFRKKKKYRYPEGGMSFEQILEAGTAKRSTSTSPSTGNQLQEDLTSDQQDNSSAANEVLQDLELNSLPTLETVASQLHNQTLSFAHRAGQFVGQLQNEVSLCDDVYQILVCIRANCMRDIRMFKCMKTLYKKELPNLYRSSIVWKMRMQWARYVDRIGR